MRRKSIFNAASRAIARNVPDVEVVMMGGVLCSMMGFLGYVFYQDESHSNDVREETRSLEEIMSHESDGAIVSLKGENTVLFVTINPEDSFTFDMDDQFVIEHSREKGGTPQSSSFAAFNNPGMINRATAMACIVAQQAEDLPPTDAMVSDANKERIENARRWSSHFRNTHCGTPAP